MIWAENTRSARKPCSHLHGDQCCVHAPHRHLDQYRFGSGGPARSHSFRAPGSRTVLAAQDDMVARQGVEWLLREGDTSAEARWAANTDLAAWDLMAMTSAKAGGVSHSIERSQKWMVGNHDVGKRCYEDGHVINATPADALAQKALLLAFLGDSTALESISAVDLIPQPGLSDVTNYWLALALFVHGRSNFQVQVDPYKGCIFGDQQWDMTMPDLGCLSSQADPTSHALRLLSLGIYYRSYSVYPSATRAIP